MDCHRRHRDPSAERVICSKLELTQLNDRSNYLVFMRLTNCTSIKNMSIESNWPYEATSSVPLPQDCPKIWPIAESTLPLGVRLYSPQSVAASPEKPILSHHFVRNTFRTDRYDKLSSIKSLGDQEHEDTELRAAESPLYGRSTAGYRKGSETPLSRFAKTPSSLPYRQSHVSTRSPEIKKRIIQSHSDIEVESFEKRVAIMTSAKAL